MEDRSIWIIFGIAIVALLVFMPLGAPYSYRGMMSMMYGGWDGMWAFGWFFMALLIVLIVLAIIWLIRQLQTPYSVRRR